MRSWRAAPSLALQQPRQLCPSERLWPLEVLAAALSPAAGGRGTARAVLWADRSAVERRGAGAAVAAESSRFPGCPRLRPGFGCLRAWHQLGSYRAEGFWWEPDAASEL